MVIVRKVEDKSDPAAKKQFGRKRSATEATQTLHTRLVTLNSFIADIDRDQFNGKYLESDKNKLCAEISDVKAWLTSLGVGTVPHDVTEEQKSPTLRELKKKLKKLEKVAKPLVEKVSVAGFYYPFTEDMRPFPEKTIFNQLVDLLCSGIVEGASGGSDERSLWRRALFWRKTVFVNDRSGWILRQHSQGWEFVPRASWESEPEFFVEAANMTLPPKSGWLHVLSGTTGSLAVFAPLSSRSSPAVEEARPHRKSGFRFFNPAVGELKSSGVIPPTLPFLFSHECL